MLQQVSRMRVNALSKPNYDVIHSRDYNSRDLRLKIKVRKKKRFLLSSEFRTPIKSFRSNFTIFANSGDFPAIFNPKFYYLSHHKLAIFELFLNRKLAILSYLDIFWQFLTKNYRNKIVGRKAYDPKLNFGK